MKTILFVEDDPFLIDIYTKKFKKSGFDIKVADSGEKALSMIRDAKPDIVLLDIVLPEIGGWEIIKKIKENPEMDDLKIVILSNLGQRTEVEKGLNLGAARYLIKAQYTPSEVVEEIKKISQ